MFSADQPTIRWFRSEWFMSRLCNLLHVAYQRRKYNFFDSHALRFTKDSSLMGAYKPHMQGTDQMASGKFMRMLLVLLAYNCSMSLSLAAPGTKVPIFIKIMDDLFTCVWARSSNFQFKHVSSFMKSDNICARRNSWILCSVQRLYNVYMGRSNNQFDSAQTLFTAGHLNMLTSVSGRY